MCRDTKIATPMQIDRSGRVDQKTKNEYSFFIPKLSDAALDERRTHILRAAELCFARDGFHSTTIADVRKEAGVSTGAIYTYFPNKEAMIRAILEMAREDRRRQLAAAANAEGGVTSQALVLLGWVNAIFGAQGQHAARVDVNLWAEALRSPRVEKLAQGALRDATSAVSTVVAARLAASPVSPSLAPTSVAHVLIALFLGLEVQTAVGVRIEPGEVLQVLTTLFAEYMPVPVKAAVAGRKRSRRRKHQA